MALIRVLVRSIVFLVALVCYFAAAIITLALAGFSFKRARPFLNVVVSHTAKVGLKIFNVKVRKLFAPIDSNENFLIVSNHLSYLDIMIISSFFPTCFVTSYEMKETPVLGQICLLAGCLFVERRNKAGLANEVKELSDALSDGLNIVIFPEATSTNGEAVIRFRRPLFQAAINSHSKVLPMCINYRTLDGEKLTLKNRDKICWYGDMGFLGHALTLFSHKSIVAELSVMPSVVSTQFEDKSALAEKCYEIVSQEYDIITHAL
jgi:1-acyl-sn-glycerol-3-phosphate acyltransferase